MFFSSLGAYFTAWPSLWSPHQCKSRESTGTALSLIPFWDLWPLMKDPSRISPAGMCILCLWGFLSFCFGYTFKDRECSSVASGLNLNKTSPWVRFLALDFWNYLGQLQRCLLCRDLSINLWFFCFIAILFSLLLVHTHAHMKKGNRPLWWWIYFSQSLLFSPPRIYCALCASIV